METTVHNRTQNDRRGTRPIEPFLSISTTASSKSDSSSSKLEVVSYSNAVMRLRMRIEAAEDRLLCDFVADDLRRTGVANGDCSVAGRSGTISRVSIERGT